jgi:uncharacterized protein YjdB
MRPFLIALIVGSALSGQLATAQTPAPAPAPPQRVDITPATADAEVGQTLKFAAVGIDPSGKPMEATPTAWVAAPFDTAAADLQGNVTFFEPGQVRVGAIINGKSGFAVVTVKPQGPASIQIESPASPVVAGGGINLHARAFTASGNPLADAELTWRSESPTVASVDAAGFVTALAPGVATIRATTGTASVATTVRVVGGRLQRLTVEPRSAAARTGDVVHFSATASGADAAHPAVRWSVSGTGASIDADGTFVAEQPGSYVVTAASGERAAAASVVVTPRLVQRPLELVGRTPAEEFQTLEQWIVGNYAYVTSFMAGRLWVYDISSPAAPVKVDSITFDARVLNDVSTTADGRIAVVSREGASNRKNGIVFLDTSDQAHPKVISEYTETVTGGVHSAFVDGTYVYLTDDATGSLRVIDFRDVKAPREVGRWEPARKTRIYAGDEGERFTGGLMLHDVQVKDGLLYAAYWRDGLIVLDVGRGIKGGTPEKPVLVSQLRFNYHELYGSGWLAGAHAVFRYKNYVFVGDEVFPAVYDMSTRDRIPVQGMVHVIDVSDIERPRKVAVYEVPEGGAHNVWVEDDVLYMGYYNAGARVVDVSGELRGNLYRQGREIARLWTGDPKGWRPNLPFAWGAQPHKGLVYFNDINSGVWITRLPTLKTAKPATNP